MSNKNRQQETLSEIIALISKVDNNESLNKILDELKYRRSAIGRSVGYTLSVGQNVLVRGNKIGTEEGVVEKVNRTRAVINIDGKSWNVPFSMIETI